MAISHEYLGTIAYSVSELFILVITASAETVCANLLL
jgi:hypothetical protein